MGWDEWVRAVVIDHRLLVAVDVFGSPAVDSSWQLVGMDLTRLLGGVDPAGLLGGVDSTGALGRWIPSGYWRRWEPRGCWRWAAKVDFHITGLEALVLEVSSRIVDPSEELTWRPCSSWGSLIKTDQQNSGGRVKFKTYARYLSQRRRSMFGLVTTRRLTSAQAFARW